jgi:hypothetical protein
VLYGELLQEGSAACIPEELQPALEPLLETIASLSTCIRHYDRGLEELAQEHYPETKLLGQVLSGGRDADGFDLRAHLGGPGTLRRE